MWSAQGPTLERNDWVLKAQELWKWIAKLDCILVNWACPWLPNEAAIWAKESGWFVVWISPAFSEIEHVETYKSPLTSYDIVMYTGKWLLERDITNIRSSDAIITVWGWVWTLNEFIVAYDEMKIVWVLTWTWWVSDNLPAILEMCNREVTNRIIFDSDPKTLAEKVVLALKELPQPTVEDERVVKNWNH